MFEQAQLTYCLICFFVPFDLPVLRIYTYSLLKLLEMQSLNNVNVGTTARCSLCCFAVLCGCCYFPVSFSRRGRIETLGSRHQKRWVEQGNGLPCLVFVFFSRLLPVHRGHTKNYPYLVYSHFHTGECHPNKVIIS